jgi:hypothetical protein
VAPLSRDHDAKLVGPNVKVQEEGDGCVVIWPDVGVTIVERMRPSDLNVGHEIDRCSRF